MAILLLATAAVVAVVTAVNISFRAGRGFYTAVYAEPGTWSGRL